MSDNRPVPTQPEPLEGYWSPEDADKILSWDYVDQRMTSAKNYWISTINPNGCPHAVPIWGVWIKDTLYFSGGPGTRWFRNVRRSPYVSIHLDDSDRAVILEGKANLIEDPQADEALVTIIQDAYEVKYGMRHPLPVWQLELHKVVAWESMQTATRWQFINKP